MERDSDYHRMTPHILHLRMCHPRSLAAASTKEVHSLHWYSGFGTQNTNLKDLVGSCRLQTEADAEYARNATLPPLQSVIELTSAWRAPERNADPDAVPAASPGAAHRHRKLVFSRVGSALKQCQAISCSKVSPGPAEVVCCCMRSGKLRAHAHAPELNPGKGFNGVQPFCGFRHGDGGRQGRPGGRHAV